MKQRRKLWHGSIKFEKFLIAKIKSNIRMASSMIKNEIDRRIFFSEPGYLYIDPYIRIQRFEVVSFLEVALKLDPRF